MKKTSFKFIFIFGLLICKFNILLIAQTKLITSISGNGINGFSGDGGPASVAELGSPINIKIDGSGNIFFADEGNSRIRKINTSGIIKTVAGCCGSGIAASGFSGDGGPATNAKLHYPFDLAFDHTGNMYIADNGNNRIRKVDTNGIISTFAGMGTAAYYGDGLQATLAQLNNPSGLVVDDIGNVYICDTHNQRIRKVDTFGIISTFAGTGTAGYSGDGGPATNALIYNPEGIIIDGAGNFLFADEHNSCIRKIDASSNITTIAGTGTSGYTGDGLPATASELNIPYYLAIDGTGNLFISDVLNNRIRKVNASGIITTVAGNGIVGYSGDDSCAAIYAEFNNPIGIANDALGNLYISDEFNRRIRKTKPNHSPSFVTGHVHNIALCENMSLNLDSLLAISDSDAGQAETWSVSLAAMHGTATGAYTVTSTGSVLIPSGLSYLPATGYIGPDTFKIAINDCANGTDTITFRMTMGNCALGINGNSYSNDWLFIVPNPNLGTFTVRLTSVVNEEMEITVTNMVGEKVKEFQSVTNIPASVQMNVPAGIYFLTAKTSHGITTSKIVVNP